MRLYLAGTDSAGDCDHLIDIPDSAFLVSYWYILKGKGKRVVTRCVECKRPLFLDSGAFSALHSGAQIDLDQYCDYCKENKDLFDVIAQLDVIGDWRGTQKNLAKMINRGINPIPVFHTDEPFEWLHELLTHYDYIAIGVTGGLTAKFRLRREIMAWCIKVFKTARRVNPVCHFHGFALTAAPLLMAFDWRSCDSATWKKATAMNNIISPDMLRQVRMKDRTRNLFKHPIPTDVITPKHPTLEQKQKLERWNAETLVNFARSVTKSWSSPQPT